MTTSLSQRPALRLVEDTASELGFAWFCGHCAAPSPHAEPPAPNQRVCTSCGLGLLLESRQDLMPSARDAFLVVDSQLLVQALSRRAETLLGVTEELAVNRPIAELLVPADAEAQGSTRLAAAVSEALIDDEPVNVFVRPWNTFGVRMRVRIGPCGPPRAALLVLDDGPRLRAVGD
jgi:PAS domain-containing protein